MENIAVYNIYLGQVETIKTPKKEFKSAYKKKAITQDEYLSKTGFINDVQSDTKHHGGVNRALCVYPYATYEYFKKEHNLDLKDCSFGENITILTYDDSDICLGDQVSFEDAIVEVTQPRQPCSHISNDTGIKNLTALTVKNLKTGFYLRVLKEGTIKKDSTLQLIKRVHESITIEFINKCFFDAKNNQENIKKVLACVELSINFREELEKKLKS